MYQETHHFVATPIIIGSGKNLLDTTATGKGLLANKDSPPASEAPPQPA